MDYYKRNNFDLIRLAAASQVLLIHATAHLSVAGGPWLTVAAYFPGVPAFFFISGFLISASWERNPTFRTFAVNRVLRIFPALCATLAFSVATPRCQSSCRVT